MYTYQYTRQNRVHKTNLRQNIYCIIRYSKINGFTNSLIERFVQVIKLLMRYYKLVQYSKINSLLCGWDDYEPDVLSLHEEGFICWNDFSQAISIHWLECRFSFMWCDCNLHTWKSLIHFSSAEGSINITFLWPQLAENIFHIPLLKSRKNFCWSLLKTLQY